MEITGRITRDTSISTTKSDKQVVYFNITLNEVLSDQRRRKERDYRACALLYWTIPAAAVILTKGTSVQVFGKISTQRWRDSEGSLKASLQFHISNITMLGEGSRTGPHRPADGG